MRDTFWNLFLIAVVFYIVCWFHGKGMMRVALLPVFVHGIQDNIAATGTFSWLRALAWGAVIYVPVILYINLATNFVYTPPALPREFKTAVMKLGKIEKDDIQVYQQSPTRLVVSHGSRATFGETFYREQEVNIENACHVDIEQIAQYQSGVFIFEFSRARTRKPAQFWVATETGLVKIAHVQKFVYFIADDIGKYVKIGFSKNPESIRMPEARRWLVNPKIIAKFPVIRQQDETAIHHLFDQYRVNGENELFLFDDEIKEWIEQKKQEIVEAS